MSAFLQKLLEFLKERSVRKSAFFVTRLGPRVAEIDVYNVERFLGERFFYNLGVSENKLEILKLLCFCLFKELNSC